MKSAATKQKSRRRYTKHGLSTMKTAMVRLGNRAIDGRSRVALSLKKWRRELVQDLGGDVSIQQGAVIDLAVKSKLILDSIDSWLLVQPSLVNARKKALLPVVKERQTLAEGLARYMAMLGLERRVKTKTLADLLNEDNGGDDNANDDNAEVQ
jgi:hypothetical protein